LRQTFNAGANPPNRLPLPNEMVPAPAALGIVPMPRLVECSRDIHPGHPIDYHYCNLLLRNSRFGREYYRCGALMGRDLIPYIVHKFAMLL
jgi:hypothetical protein